MGIDGPIDSFAPFHNVNCPRGFLYFNRQVRRLSLVPVSCRHCPRPEQLWKQRAKIVEPGGAKGFNSGFILGRLRMRHLGYGGESLSLGVHPEFIALM